MPIKLTSLGGPAPEEHQELDCAALDAQKTRLLAQRDELNKPQLSSEADGERQAELTRLNGKLYTVAKGQFDKSCAAVATAPSSVVR
jgi:RecB family exonuclease